MGFVSPESAISKPLKLELDQVQQLVELEQLSLLSHWRIFGIAKQHKVQLQVRF